MEGKDVDGMLTASSASATAEAWLGDFGAALASGDAAQIAALFAEDCHWRDILAFTWDLRTHLRRRRPSRSAWCRRWRAWRRAGSRWPRAARRRGASCAPASTTIEAIFAFETSVGPCNGVVRLVSEGWGHRAPGR